MRHANTNDAVFNQSSEAPGNGGGAVQLDELGTRDTRSPGESPLHLDLAGFDRELPGNTVGDLAGMIEGDDQQQSKGLVIRICKRYAVSMASSITLRLDDELRQRVTSAAAILHTRRTRPDDSQSY